MVLLSVSGISRKEKDRYTVKNISFEQESFQKIAIAGETGSGKTTLLKMIGGLIHPDEGTILFQGKKVLGPNYQLIPGEAGMAYLSQHFELRNNYWVHEILSYANELTQEVADELYSICRIDHLLNRRTDQLSGGEKQRIALARLLIGAPRLLLLDEPFSNLDATHKTIMKSVLDDINARLGISCILVSHDAADTLSWADTILVMHEGTIIQKDQPEQIYRQPVNEYCAGLFGEYNLVDSANELLLQTPASTKASGKKLMVRPEQFILLPSGGGIDCKIKNKWFMGSYYIIEVLAGSQLLKVKMTNNSFQQGDEGKLSLTGAQHCYV